MLSLSLPRKRHQAFSMVELLVVLTIIVILIAMLLPTLSQARRIAQQAKCLSQLRQQGIALSAYRSDNNDYFAMMYNAITDPAGTYTRPFTYMLSEYLGTRTVYSSKLGSPGYNYSSAGFDTARSGYHIFYCPSVPLYTRASYDYPLRNDAWLYGPWWDYNIATYNMLTSLGASATASNPTDSYYDWMHTKRVLVNPARTLVYIDGRYEPRVDHSYHLFQARHNGTANYLRGDYSATNGKKADLDNTLSYDRVFHLYDPPRYRYAR